MSAFLSLEDVHKSFGALHVLRGVSLDVPKGEVLVLIGRSGSGKSTLLQCVAGLTPIQGGTIAVDGNVVHGPKSAVVPAQVRRTCLREVGMVFQSFNLFPHLTIIDNIILAPTKVRGMKTAQAREKAMALLSRVGLADKAAQYPAQLSGGQQQRVAIARALAMEPQLMLFDEVTSALDPELVGEVLQVMRDLADEGMTMISVTHEMQFAREVADRVIYMHEGVIVEDASPDRIFTSPSHEETRQFLSRIA
ncbi:MAG: amino acid ABC transporter ATP-binding protein [Pseudomonadota bacterium]